MMTSFIQNNRVRLRDWQAADLVPYEKWLRPGQRWQELDGPYYQSDEDRSAERVAALKERMHGEGFPTPRERLVIADAVTNEFIGTVSSYWESIETRWLCLGISIYDPKFWGKGFGFAAMGLWIDYLFLAYPDIVRLDMRTWSGNHGLMALATKLGFAQEACFRQARIVAEKYYDGLGYGILRTEWAAQYPRGFGK